MALHKSGENYLKTIYLLHEKYGEVRECDIAENMGYSKPSVCHMVKVLSEQGYIFIKDNDVRLSPLGMETAKKVHFKFLVVRCFLITILGVDEVTANQDACEIEHAVNSVLSSMDASATLNEYRIVYAGDCLDVALTIAVSRRQQKNEREIRQAIEKAVSSVNTNYRVTTRFVIASMPKNKFSKGEKTHEQ